MNNKNYGGYGGIVEARIFVGAGPGKGERSTGILGIKPNKLGTNIIKPIVNKPSSIMYKKLYGYHGFALEWSFIIAGAL